MQTIRVSIGQYAQLVISQPGQIAAARIDSHRDANIVYLLRREHMLMFDFPGIQNLASQRQNCLGAAIAALDWDLPLDRAVALPHVVNRNGATDLEEGTAAAGLAPALEALGHEVIATVTDEEHGLYELVARSASHGRREFRVNFELVQTVELRRLRRLAAGLPLDSIVLETDAPDIPVAAHRGERNSPEYLPDCLQALAEVRNADAALLAAQTTRNACAVLHLAEVSGGP